MSGNNNESGSYDDFDERQDGTGGGLRKQLESVLAEVKDLRAELAKRDQKSAEDVLKDKGLDPAIKELIPADQDPQEWVEKYAHLLGVKPAKSEAEDEDNHDDPEIVAPVEEDAALIAERVARSEIQGAADAGSPAHLTGDVLERMDKIGSEEELLKFFQSNGAAGG